MDFGRALSLCRARRGITQADLAERAGLSVSYLSLLEKNKRKDPTLSTIQKLAEALSVPTGILFFLAADKTEMSGLDETLLEKLAYSALELLNERKPEPTLL